MEHYVHLAMRLSGGEHLGWMATLFGVTVQDLISDEEATHPADEPAPPRGTATHIALAVFRCGCPGSCPSMAPVPPVAVARARVVLAADMLARV